jgi:hypothetical protein
VGLDILWQRTLKTGKESKQCASLFFSTSRVHKNGTGNVTPKFRLGVPVWAKEPIIKIWLCVKGDYWEQRIGDHYKNKVMD